MLGLALVGMLLLVTAVLCILVASVPIESLLSRPSATGKVGRLKSRVSGLTRRSWVPVACMMNVRVLAALRKPAVGPSFELLAAS